jgi:AcrR family transcriptional regulator
VTSVSTAHTDRTAGPADPSPYRQRLLDGLADSVAEDGYHTTTVADIVRRARTSRRTFYEHFASKEACFIALLTEANTAMIHRITSAVDPSAPWERQVRQAVEAWIASAESSRAITLSWIRDLPSLGTAARQFQRDMMEDFITMLQALWDTDEWHAVGVGPVSRQLAVILLGGLRELIATTVEDGGRISDITEIAVRASVGLLRSPTGP